MDLIFDLNQYQQIGANRQQAQDATNRARKTEDLYEELLLRHEKMALVCQALLELVQERTGITDEDLEKKILEVDLRDGKADGRVGTEIYKCSSCGRNVSSKRPVCIFCGTKTKGEHSF